MSGIEKAARVARGLAVITLVLVSFASLFPDPRASELQRLPVVIALGHVIMHFGVTTCFLIGWHGQLSRIVPLTLAIAVFMEVAQAFVPGREFDISEMTANLAGVGLAWMFFQSLRRFSHRRHV